METTETEEALHETIRRLKSENIQLASELSYVKTMLQRYLNNPTPKGSDWNFTAVPTKPGTRFLSIDIFEQPGDGLRVSVDHGEMEYSDIVHGIVTALAVMTRNRAAFARLCGDIAYNAIDYRELDAVMAANLPGEEQGGGRHDRDL